MMLTSVSPSYSVQHIFTSTLYERAGFVRKSSFFNSVRGLLDVYMTTSIYYAQFKKISQQANFARQQLYIHLPVFPEKQEGTGDCWRTVLKPLLSGKFTGTQDHLLTAIQIHFGSICNCPVHRLLGTAFLCLHT